jgi:hypothetical protein
MDAKAFDPRREMGPHLADISSHRNRHSFSTDWITNAVLQFKTFEVIAWPSRLDISGKRGTGIPRPLNCWEVPDNEVVLHVASEHFLDLTAVDGLQRDQSDRSIKLENQKEWLPSTCQRRTPMTQTMEKTIKNLSLVAVDTKMVV